MSKRALKKYIADLDKEALETQLLDLYERIPQVKVFYDFVFNPKEEKLVDEAKVKISNEYFPTRRKRPRKRPSVAQKYIKLFKSLGMDPNLLADLMLFNIEIAQTFNDRVQNTPEAFYKSMFNSFKEVLQWLSYHSLLDTYATRVEKIIEQTELQNWSNTDLFDAFANEIVD
jgi:hypothetical protein